MTQLHAGGKFDNDSYKFSAGLHGVGVSVVNALSEWLELEIRRDGKVYRQSYERGRPTSDRSMSSEPPTRPAPRSPSVPTPRSSKRLEFSYDTLSQRFRELAFLNRGITIALVDERAGKEKQFHFEGGIVSFVEHLNKNRNPLHYARILHRGRRRRHGVRDRDAVERRVPGGVLLLREHRQHPRGRHAPVRPSRGADASHQSIRVAEQPDQGPSRRHRR